MIASDQPTIFGPDVLVAVSSVQDGNMRLGHGDDKTIMRNRRRFLRSCGVNPEQTTLVSVVYQDASSFTRYRVAKENEKGAGMAKEQTAGAAADGMVVNQSGHALFLPLADCVGVVLYDPKSSGLMLSHIGRHSAESSGAAHSVAYLQSVCGTDPSDFIVWLSPAVGRPSYPLHQLGNKSLHEVITGEFIKNGVHPDNIERSRVDTAQDENYFSHSQFIAGQRQETGRFAVVAMLRARPALGYNGK